MELNPVVIVAAKRTPIGNFQGCLSSLSATELGSVAIKACLAQTALPVDRIESVIMGCVLTAGLGQAPARQAALIGGIPAGAGCTTVNKMCGSGMEAVILAHDQLLAGSHTLALAGGMESMSNAPYLLPQARRGYRRGNHTVVDHLLFDGLTDGFNKTQLMGSYAEECAKEFSFTRKQQDHFALQSMTKARQATAAGWLQPELAATQVTLHKQEITITQDEGPQTAQPEKIAALKPAFAPDGTITAANASSISDGAAALILMRRDTAHALQLKPLATIKAHSTYANVPERFTTAPIGAIKKVLQKSHWTINDVDLFEINEAFAVVTLATCRVLNIPESKVNLHGGACALGHPIGASGARILTSLLYALIQHQLTRGIASLCIGGGEATAIALEREESC